MEGHHAAETPLALRVLRAEISRGQVSIRGDISEENQSLGLLLHPLTATQERTWRSPELPLAGAQRAPAPPAPPAHVRPLRPAAARPRAEGTACRHGGE